MTERAVLEVPTLRADARLHPLLLGVVVLNLLQLLNDLSLPVMAGLWTLMVAGVLIGLVRARRAARQRPRVQVTADRLRIPLDDGTTVDVDWADVAAARVARRWLIPHLVVEPVDPDRMLPAPDRWQRAALTRRGRYRLEVALGGGRAARTRLKAELTART
jgi:hypothetical protein